jgi:hypothetical protein
MPAHSSRRITSCQTGACMKLGPLLARGPSFTHPRTSQQEIYRKDSEVPRTPQLPDRGIKADSSPTLCSESPGTPHTVPTTYFPWPY